MTAGPALLASRSANWVPLCVDLDGTLIKTDTLLESLLVLLRQQPVCILLLPFWLLRGKAYLKRQIGLRAQLDVGLLPLHADFLTYLHEQALAGRPIYLATACDQALANAVGQHLGLFDGVMASNGVINLRSTRKLSALVDLFGEKGFDYAGNSPADLPIWSKARKAVVVNAAVRVTRRVGSLPCELEREFPRLRDRWRLWSKALRIHQWTKNLLLLAPAVLAHRLTDAGLWVHLGIGFASFSLASSGVYIVNDLLDLNADRKHLSKKSRPFASGELSLWAGCAMAPALWAASFGIASLLPPEFSLVLAGYMIATLSYSLFLKKEPLLDIVLLGALYGLRIFAGGAAGHIAISPWLLMFSSFFFFSLASAKRCVELRSQNAGNWTQTPNRGYFSGDTALLTMLGVASGYVSILVIALYLHSSENSILYSHPERLWLVCPILMYWISRVWLLMQRNQLDADPVVFALRDRASYIICLMIGLLLYVAS